MRKNKMKKIKILSLLIISSILFSCSNKENVLPEGNSEDIDVILLYGQSNAVGTTPNYRLKQYDKKLYNKYSKSNDLVFIKYHSDDNISEKFVGTKLGQGHKDNYFGPEIGMTNYIEEKVKNKVAIIKSTYGGTILSTQWLDGNYNRGTLYIESIRFTKLALKSLKDMNYNPNIKGICWMQGESDAIDDNWTQDYIGKTRSFVSYFREDLKEYSESIKFVDAGIDDLSWKNHEQINNDKYNYSLESELNYYFSTIDLGFDVQKNDKAHYNGESEFKLGYTFGRYLYEE